MGVSALRLSLVVASLAACTETGAHLTLVAPAGPATAKTFQVVLATPEQTPMVRDQRVAPSDRSTGDARYFLQRTIAGADSDTIDSVDGFTVRIAPGGDITETQFIPFVLMYDGSGAITGIGTYRAGTDNMPSPILVMRDEIDKYMLDVEAMTQVHDDMELAPGQLRVVTCPRLDQPDLTSGVAWRTASGEEYRLLFPDDGSLDATGRVLDMDCDDYEVTPESSYRDCDDTRRDFHRDAADVCDGKDTNCDGATTIATMCDAQQSSCVSPFVTPTEDGVQLCNDEDGSSRGNTTCAPTATCACNLGTGCHFCNMPVEASQAAPGSAAIHPCQPAIGSLPMQVCSDNEPCDDVEVITVRGGWKIKISATDANAFGYHAYGVGSKMLIKAERPEGPAWEVDPTTANAWGGGEVDFAITRDGQTIYLGLKLDLGENYQQMCPATPALTCY